jgi:hypothetical protein
MRRELWIVVLLLTAGSNSLVPEICAAHCMTPAATASAHHHHPMNADAEKRSSREGATDTPGERSADCVECAYATGHGQSLTATCVNLDPAHALKEVSLSLDKPQAASGDPDLCSGHQPILLGAAESHIFPDAPRTVGSSRTAAVAIRV